jgi:hypothetical protein
MQIIKPTISAPNEGALLCEQHPQNIVGIRPFCVLCLIMDPTQRWQTPHRAYDIDWHTFVKRELRTSELLSDQDGEVIPLPEDSTARLLNEFLTLQYLQQHTNVPVPRPISFTKEAGIAILTTSSVADGAIALSDYVGRDRDTVIRKVEQELLTNIIPALRQHKSRRMGGIASNERLLLPPRVTGGHRGDWPCFVSEQREFVLCHNDLGQSNIFIDPETHRIRTIIDWEYAGYLPPEFEASLWKYHPREQDWDAHSPQALRLLLESFEQKAQELAPQIGPADSDES